MLFLPVTGCCSTNKRPKSFLKKKPKPLMSRPRKLCSSCVHRADAAMATYHACFSTASCSVFKFVSTYAYILGSDDIGHGQSYKVWAWLSVPIVRIRISSCLKQLTCRSFLQMIWVETARVRSWNVTVWVCLLFHLSSGSGRVHFLAYASSCSCCQASTW